MLLVVVLLFTFVGCGQDARDLEPVAFDPGLLVGKRFQSQQPLPINDLGGVPQVPWNVRFDERICTWGYYEVNNIGAYEVQPDGVILVRFAPQPVWEIRAVYDPQQQRLVFDGAAYVLEQPLDQTAIRLAQADDNRRLKQFTTFLKQQGRTLQREDDGQWLLAAEPPEEYAVAVRLWAFPVGSSLQQMQAAVPDQDLSNVLFNIPSGLAMSRPGYRDPAGNQVEIERHNDERVEQLQSLFRSYEAADIPPCYWLGRDIIWAGSEPNSPSVAALMEYFQDHGFKMAYDADRDQWYDAQGTNDDLRVVVRSFPKTAGEHQMRCWARHINLAFLLNVRRRLAMSYPPDSARGKQLKQLFLAE